MWIWNISQFFQQSDENLLLEYPAFTGDIQETHSTATTALLLASQIPWTETLQVELSDKVQPQHVVPDDNTPLRTPLGLEESRFPVLLSK